MVELIALFVEELPARVDLLRSHLERRDLVELRRIAHQLKGACGGYGFPDVGRVAASLESLLEHAAPTDPETELNTIRGRVDELARMCSRVSVS
jgi:HPt (histidine-containing phosphotransfer) domain-containing protein